MYKFNDLTGMTFGRLEVIEQNGRTSDIECKKCGAVPYVHQVYIGLSKEEAVNGVAEAWNNRAGEQDGLFNQQTGGD